MTRKLLVLLAIPLLGASSCGTLPQSTTDTFNKVVYAAGSVNDTAVKLIGTSVQSGAITSDQATAAVAVTDKVQAALVLADTTFKGGNQADASAKVASAMSAVIKVEACLTGPKANLTICLQGISP